jgi:L-serine dehydratase
MNCVLKSAGRHPRAYAFGRACMVRWPSPGAANATDRAICLGLLGFRPATIEPDLAEIEEERLKRAGVIQVAALPPMTFAPAQDLIFDYGPPLPGHANGLVLEARGPDGALRLSRM